jgi:long-chain acyl-CoA synthetase
MPLAVLQALTAAFPSLDVRNAYGATETASPATLMPRGATALRPLSVGRPVPKGEIRIDDPDATGVGEVLIRGPMVTPGYFQRPEENARAFTEDGYWRSGDLGYLDEEGFLFVVDRLKEVINRGGEKIYSQEVENSLYQHPGVLEAAVVGVPDPLYGERVKAVVVPRPGVSLVEDELRRFLSERLAAFKVPEIYEFRDSLPRNPGGKVLKSLLRQER